MDNKELVTKRPKIKRGVYDHDHLYPKGVQEKMSSTSLTPSPKTGATI